MTDAILNRQIALTILALSLSYFGVWLWTFDRNVHLRWYGGGCVAIGLTFLVWTWGWWL